MIVKNIVINEDDMTMKIIVSDSNMTKTKKEKRVSEVFDRVIEACINNKNFEKEIL